ncbi:MAG: hypothetical protein HRU41_14615 [Saprospiraceae bacterium]|nr:hypothetical protein [Saprospiraceae bacterium]
MYFNQWKQHRRWVFYASLGLFLFSLTQPAFYIDRADFDAWSSPIGLLLMGWLGIMAGDSACMAWLANPLLILGAVSLFKFDKFAPIFGILALAVGLSFLGQEQIISSEAPTYSKITEIKLGYWLWITSMAAFTAGSTYLLLIKPKDTQEDNFV